MIPDAVEVCVTPSDRLTLEARVRAQTSDRRDVLRAWIVLLAGENRSTRSIAKLVDVMPRTVSLWRGRYAHEGLAGLSDKPRPGPRPKRRRDGQTYPCGPGRAAACWLCPMDGPLIAAHPRDVHKQQVWRFLRAQRIDLLPRKSWCESKDPDFVAKAADIKAADIVGLYMAPPQNALVICVDEKPSIQALNGRRATSSCPTAAP